jgi:hypothetical protein
MSIEDQPLIRVVDIRLDEVGIVVREALGVLVLTAGSLPVARAEKISPNKGLGRLSALLNEVFDVSAIRINTRLAVSAPWALHRFQMRPDFLPLLWGKD